MTKGVIVIEGHVQGLANTRLLGKAGVPVIVVDKGACIAKYSRYCKKFFVCPDFAGDDFADFLIRLNRNEGLQDWLLLPSNDHAVYTISRHKDRLKQYYKVITEDLKKIERIYNKRILLSLALSANIPIPETVMPEFENPDSVSLRFPVLIKGNQGLSFYKKYKQKALKFDSPQDLASVWKGLLRDVAPSEYFIQEVIPYVNKTISVAVFAVNGHVHSYWMGVKLREHPPRFGTATCCKSIYDEELLALSKELIRKISYSGVCEIEWLKDSRDNKHKLIEINARTWMWVGFAGQCGVNFPLEIYEYAVNNVIPKSVRYPLGRYWLNLYTDIPFSMVRIVKRIDDLHSILHSYCGFYEACWMIGDVKPFFMYGVMLLSFLKKR